jgi:DNA-binding CsgD family transcriptional regulator
METYVLNACRQIRAARSNRELRGLLEGLLCKTWGWDNYAFVAHVPTRFAFTHGLMVTNYPVRWLLHYMRKGYYRADPLVAHCQNHNLGMIWTSKPKDWANFSPEVQEIATMARKEGWTGGVAIPVPAMPCRGTFALLTRQPLDLVKTMLDNALLLGPVIGLHIHDALLEIALSKTFSALDRKNLYLTDLEKDILQWTADGMPGKQVADQLGISVKAVERQLERVRERFKAPNRAKMLVMGYALGLIQAGYAWSHGSIVNAEGFEDRLEKLFSEGKPVPPHLVYDYLYDELPDDDQTP